MMKVNDLKKAMVAGLSALLLTLALCAPAFAEAQLDHVTDVAALFTEEQCVALENRAQSISDEYQCGVYIITLQDYTADVDTDDIEVAAKTIYTQYDLGYGEDKSGILLLQSTADHDYTLVAYGYGNTAFTDFGKKKLAETFVDNFKNEDWNGGYTDYLEKCSTMLESARNGHPLDVKSNPMVVLVGILVSITLGCAASGIICMVLRQSMSSVAKGTEADAYIPAESIAISRREDNFTHTTEVRTKTEKKSDSGSGGTAVDSGGFSASSGKY